MLSARSKKPLMNSSTFSWKILSLSFFVVFILSALFFVFTAEINVDRYYVYAGTTGPYSTTSDVPNPTKQNLKINKLSSVFHAGEWLGYRSDLTTEPGLNILFIISLYDVKAQRIIVFEEIPQPSPDFRRTGPRDLFYYIPETLAPGFYEIRRRLVFRKNKDSFFNIPAGTTFTPIPFEVVK